MIKTIESVSYSSVIRTIVKEYIYVCLGDLGGDFGKV